MYDPFKTFEKRVLPNGLTLYHSRHERPFFHAYVTIHAGGREDVPGKEGTAHFLEHVVSYASRDYPDYLENRKFFTSTGGWANFGTTGHFSTQYSFFLPHDLDIVKKGADIFGTMLLGARIEHRVEEERGIILQEYSRQFPDEKMLVLNRTSYRIGLGENHRLSHSTVIGKPESIKAITASDLQAFYDRYYVPANMSVVTSGSMTVEEVVEIITASGFGASIAGVRNGIPEPIIPPKPSKNYAEESVSKLFSIKTQQATYDKTWVLPVCDPDTVSFLAKTLSQVISDEIREKRSLAYSFSVSFTNYQEFNFFYIGGDVSADKAREIDPIVRELMADIENLKKVFEEVKDRRLKSLALYDEAVEKYTEDAAEDVEVRQRILTNQEVYENAEKVTWEDVEKILALLTPEQAVLFLQMP